MNIYSIEYTKILFLVYIFSNINAFSDYIYFDTKLYIFRTGTTGSDYSLPERRVGSLQYKKRISHQTSTLSEDIKHQYNSSSESIGSIHSKAQLSKPKTKAVNSVQPISTNSSMIPEVAKELRLIQRPVNAYKFGDDRLVLVSNQHVPFVVFSAIPYNKGQRSSW